MQFSCYFFFTKWAENLRNQKIVVYLTLIFFTSAMQINNSTKIILFLLFLGTLTTYGQISIGNLKTDYQQTPLGNDSDKPSFSWEMKNNENLRGLYQKAYQIIVTDQSDNVVWDSQKINNSSSLSIFYEGKKLEPTTRYKWKVNVWNQSNKLVTAQSWFETGLMNPDPKLSAWDGAQWIGGSGDDLLFYSQYLSVFKFKYNVQLDEKSKSVKAAFIFGANDRRLMDKNFNLQNAANKKDESYIKLELDLSNVNGNQKGKAKLNLYRIGYTKEDLEFVPLKSIEIPAAIIDEKNKYASHEIMASSVFGVLSFYVNGTDQSHKLGKDVNINPMGWGADYIAFPVVGDIGFALEKGQKASFSNLAIMNFRAPSNKLFAENLSDNNYTGIFHTYRDSKKEQFKIENNKYVLNGLNQPVLIMADPSRNASGMLRTEFTAKGKKIKKARLYATSRGIYELYLNGEKIGNEYFSPGLTQYDKTQLYQTYDVTDKITSDVNAFGAILSEGWWSGNITYRGENWNYFGDRQSLLAKVVITYEDGSTQVVTTNSQEWKYYNDGPVRYGSFFQGEVYDANKEAGIFNWSKKDFNDSQWAKAETVALEGSTYGETTVNDLGQKINLDFSQMKLTGMPGVTATVVKTLNPVSVEEVRPGIFVYDMGQNMVGVPKIEFENTSKFDTISVRYAEVKYPNLKQYSNNKGMIMLENMRAAMVRDIYICKGNQDVLEPRFTFHGFRFLEITGIKKILPLDKIKGLVISSVDSITSDYETSNPSVNRLWQNIVWSTRANFLYIPTDTPARNERMGWSGDINVFSRTATYLTNAAPFFKRHMLAMRDLQKNGRFTDTAPVVGAFGGILWGSAGIIVAWESYQQYGDIAMLSEHYPAMKEYIEFLSTRKDPETGAIIEGPLGDWLSPENSKTDNRTIWDAYYIYDLEIMSKAAKILNKSDDQTYYTTEYNKRKKLFNESHIDPKNAKTIHNGVASYSNWSAIPENKKMKKGAYSDSQASYAIPLAFGVFDKEYEQMALKNLLAAVERKNEDDLGVLRPEYSLMTGFIGTASISNALSRFGKDQYAYRLLLQKSYPSWLYSVENGATTIWERLNSYTVENGFGGNNNMNSFNHYSFGAVGAWMMNYSLGIERDGPGFKKFILQPVPDPDGVMTFAKGYYHSLYGKIYSEWKSDSTQTVYIFEIPANTSATVFLKCNNIDKITESGKKIKKAKGVTYARQNGDKIILNLVSGKYEFIIKK